MNSLGHWFFYKSYNVPLSITNNIVLHKNITTNTYEFKKNTITFYLVFTLLFIMPVVPIVCLLISYYYLATNEWREIKWFWKVTNVAYYIIINTDINLKPAVLVSGIPMDRSFNWMKLFYVIYFKRILLFIVCIEQYLSLTFVR